MWIFSNIYWCLMLLTLLNWAFTHHAALIDWFFSQVVSLTFPFFPVISAKSTSECPRKQREQSSVQRGAALGARSGNVQKRGAGPGNKKKSGNQTQSKGNKRKQVDSEQHEGSENEPPEKKQPTSVPSKMPTKNVSKGLSKKKLIAGQGKLTSFFRVWSYWFHGNIWTSHWNSCFLPLTEMVCT